MPKQQITQLNFDEFASYVTESDEIDGSVLHDDGAVHVTNIANTDPCILAEMFVLAHDCQLLIGPFFGEKDSIDEGSVVFHKKEEE